jgi:hypothetical protein
VNHRRTLAKELEQFLKPSEIETHLILNPKFLNNLVELLIHVKHMLTGATGTGKII